MQDLETIVKRNAHKGKNKIPQHAERTDTGALALSNAFSRQATAWASDAGGEVVENADVGC